VNYCNTVHKSQGETIEEDFTIWDWKFMPTKLRYTALSRARLPRQVSFANRPFSKETVVLPKILEKKITGSPKI
jgi:ATP-dependent exoDNAse (exonuclease V) alpha subunit